MRTKLLLSIAGLTTVVACGSAASRFDSMSADAPTGGGNPNGSDAGGFASGGDADAATKPNIAGAGSVVLVHASRNLPAFRACFNGHSNTLPLPDDKIMPNANVVGVDIGTAVHIGLLDHQAGSSNADASVATYDSGVEGGVDAGPPPTGELSVIEEKLARQFFPQGTDASAWPNCGDLVSVLKQNGYEGHGLYTLTGNPTTADSNFAVFVVVKGCLPDPTLTVKECGAGFTPAKGNLSYQTLQVGAQDGSGFDFEAATASPAVADGSSLVFTPATGGGLATDPISLAAIMVSLPGVSTLPLDDLGYGQAHFDLKAPNGTTLLTQTLADIQARSAPRELPAAFFGLSSTFVLFAVGDPTVADKTAPTALHLLAVPVQDPAKIDPDSGAL